MAQQNQQQPNTRKRKIYISSSKDDFKSDVGPATPAQRNAFINSNAQLADVEVRQRPCKKRKINDDLVCSHFIYLK